MASTAFDLIYDIVRRVPPGRVTTYGQVSRILDGRYSPKFVGWALHGIPEGVADVPWHRVINSKGQVSTRQVMGYAPNIQRHLLEEEGIVFDGADRCDLEAFLWEGPEHE